MSKRKTQFLQYWMLLLILTTLLIGCGRADLSVSTVAPADKQTGGEDILITNADITTDAPEEMQPTLAAPDVKTENILSIERSEDRNTYLRILTMGYLSIPQELGDSCYVKLDVNCVLPPYIREESVEGGTRYECEAFGSAHYIKDNVYYENTTAYMTWEELVDSEQELQYLYNARATWAQYEMSGGKQLSQEELNELYAMKAGSWGTISGTLSQELYPLGQEAGIDTPSWGDQMFEAALWYTKLTGQFSGRICGDIYVVEPTETYSEGSYWICFDGMEPIKIPRIEATTYQLTEAPSAVEGADFAAEKDNALYRLSFDLLVEPAEDAEIGF